MQLILDRIAGWEAAGLIDPNTALRLRSDEQERAEPELPESVEVGTAAETVDSQATTGGYGRRAEGPITDDSRAEQGSGLLVRHPFGKPVGELLVGDAAVSVSAVDVPTGESGMCAEVFVAATAVAAGLVGAREPGNADSIPDPEAVGARSAGVRWENTRRS